MDKTYKLSVPVSMDDITIGQYQKYVKIVEENKDVEDNNFINLKLLNIFCDITMKEAYELPITQFEYIINHLSNILSDKPDLQTRFTMEDPKGKVVEFGFIPNLDKMTLGEYIDAESYLGDWQNMHKAMSVLYRPIVAGNKNFYKIENYESSDKYATIMKDAPCTVAIGSILFFLSLGIELSKTTLDSLLKQQEISKEDLSVKGSQKNGDGINQYIHLQKEMYLKLTRLQKLIYTKR